MNGSDNREPNEGLWLFCHSGGLYVHQIIMAHCEHRRMKFDCIAFDKVAHVVGDLWEHWQRERCKLKVVFVVFSRLGLLYNKLSRIHDAMLRYSFV